MNMVQTQPLQTTDFSFFLGMLPKHKRTEKICDFKSLWVSVKVKLLKMKPFCFSLMKDVFKMNAKEDQTIPVCECAAVPCRIYGSVVRGECQRQTTTTLASPHLTWLLVGHAVVTVEWTPTSWLSIITWHTQEMRRQKPDVSLQVINWKTTGWAGVNFNSIQTAIHYN